MAGEEPQLTPELLLHAYSVGVFPMADARDADEVYWVDPRKRGILPLDGFHISRSLRRRMLAASFRITFDFDFEQVVSACADRPETWINDVIFGLYSELHRTGHAHSVEVWEGDELVGGVYGVALGAAFFGESMFSKRTDASKIALAYLVDRLKQTGFRLLDTQFLTDHLASLGGREIDRAEYRRMLADAIHQNVDINSLTKPQTAQEVVQRNTQMS